MADMLLNVVFTKKNNYQTLAKFVKFSASYRTDAENFSILKNNSDSIAL